MTDTPAPLSADSLRKSIVKCFYDEQIKTDDDEIESGAKEEYIEYFDTKAVIDRLETLIAAALQSERQRIAEKIYRDIQINGHITADEFKEQYLGERNMSKLKIKQTYSKRCLYCEHLNDFLLRDTNVNTNITDDDIYRLAGNNMGEIESTWCDNCSRLTAQMTVSYNVEGANR